MLAVLQRSLVRNGGLTDFRLTAVIGASREQQAASHALAEWLAPEIESIFVDPSALEEYGLHATVERRLTTPTNAEVVVLMDADMVICGSIAEVAAETAAAPAVAGVVAHLPPGLSGMEWARVYAAAGLNPPLFPYQYTGWPLMFPEASRSQPDVAKAPPYFNYGFVVMTREMLGAIAAEHRECALSIDAAFEREHVARTMFRSQISLTLAIERAGVPHRSLGMRYNFANDDDLEALHPEELADARIIHLLRRKPEFDKHLIYRNLDTLREFTTAGPQKAGATEMARQAIGEVLADLEGTELPPGLAQVTWIW